MIGAGSAAGNWHKPALFSLASYIVITCAIVASSVCLNHGTLVYSLDDPYIHLAIAKTWLRASTLGVSPGQFAPASSGPLWTLALICVSAVLGVNDFTPLVLNVVSASAAIVLFWSGVERLSGAWTRVISRLSRHGARLVALALPVLMNLPALTLSGLEHNLHIALTLAFTIALWTRFETTSIAIKNRWGLFLLAALLPLVRNEGLFTVAAAALLLARRSLLTAAGLLACAAFPVALLGTFYLYHGAFFFPNSVVAKAVFAAPSEWIVKWGANLIFLVVDPLLLCTVILAVSCIRPPPHRTSIALYLLSIVFLHFSLAAFGGIGWLDRYESYLVALGLFFFAMTIGKEGPPFWSGSARPSGGRGTKILAGLGALEKVSLLCAAVVGSNDIFLQQYQVARFIEQYFARGNIVANDIGLVSLRAGGRVTDLAGLGSTDVLRAIRSARTSPLISTRYLTRAMIEPALDRNGADFVVLYPEWFSPLLYGQWRRVASWSMGRPPITAAYRSVVFFAVDEARAQVLGERLRAFEPQLPREVRVEYEPPVPDAHP